MSAPRRPAAKSSLFAIRTPVSPLTGRLLSVASVVLFFGVWGVCSYVMVDRGKGPEPLVPHVFLPAPDEVVRGLLYLFFAQDLLGSIWVSCVRVLKAFALSIVVAFPVGVAMGVFDSVNRFLEPIVAPLRYLPITAFIPLLILWFGIWETQKVLFLFLGTVVFLLPAVVDAIRVVPNELVETAFTLGASKAQVIRTVLLPAALPQIFDAFRVMNAIAWTYIILAELVNARTSDGSSGGIGYILNLAQTHTKPAWSFAGIFVVGVIGIGTDVLIRGINRLLFAWREVDA